jgi:hypothetical protein
VVPTDLFHDDFVGGLTIKSWGEFRLYFPVKDAENKSSLKFLHLSEARYGDCYNIWSSCGTEPFAVTMAAVKVKLAT